MTKLWVYIQGQNIIFSTSISPQDRIDDLRHQIYDAAQKSIAKFDSISLTLTKVRFITLPLRGH